MDVVSSTPPLQHSKPSKLVLNYFSLFNVQGLRPQTVQSSVPYVKDRLVEKEQLFKVLSETWLHNHKDGEIEIE